MRVVAFDVGIKNLAYCILERTNNSIKVVEWDIINIMESENKCQVGGCCINAHHQIGPDFYCVVHKDNAEESVRPKLLGQFRQCAGACNTCNKTDVFTDDSSVLCTKHRDQYINKMLKPKKLKDRKVAEFSVEQLKINLVRKLDERRMSLLQADEVVIENQPTLKNPRMKAVSDTLYTWYVIRGMVDTNQVSKIGFQAPASKLKNFDTKEIKASTNKYKTTKELAIKYALETLEKSESDGGHSENNKWIPFLKEHKKQDDLSDALLHGWYVLTTKGKKKGK